MLLEEHLKKLLKTSKLNLNPVGGGDINEAYRVVTGNQSYFLKYNTLDWSYRMFEAEKKGLELLAGASIHVPEPLKVFQTDEGAGLLLKWVNTDRRNANSWTHFGESLIKIHQSRADRFGLDHDNFIGRLDQENTWENDWISFYHLHRIEPQVKLAVDDGLLPTRAIRLMESGFKNFESLLPEVSPSLLHGDLWNGNLLFDDKGLAIFIDPAVYYGHREMDIAMMKLFGGFEPGLKIYQYYYSLENEWEERLPFYQLYYILVHVNLFGGSYVNSAMRILQRYA